jgi:hypothetical protein
MRDLLGLQLVVCLVLEWTAGCTPAAHPRQTPLLTLIAVDDTRAVHGEPMVARVGPGILMEDVAHQMFVRARKLGFTSLSSLETHARVAFHQHVYDCAIRVGSTAEVEAWEAAHPGTPAAEAELARRVTVSSAAPCASSDRNTADASHHTVMGMKATSGAAGTNNFVGADCRQAGRTHTMYEFQRLTALGDPPWHLLGLDWGEGFAESAPRCSEVLGQSDDFPTHSMSAIVYKP